MHVKTSTAMQFFHLHQPGLLIDTLAAFFCNCAQLFLVFPHRMHVRRKIIGTGGKEAKHAGDHDSDRDASLAWVETRFALPPAQNPKGCMVKNNKVNLQLQYRFRFFVNLVVDA